ncbi:MAG: hypothetical protein ACM3XN_03085 [Chloroflexota bacterium]
MALCSVCGASNTGIGGVPLVSVDDKYYCRRCLVKTKGVVRCSVCGQTAGATNDSIRTLPDGKYICSSCEAKGASMPGAAQAAAARPATVAAPAAAAIQVAANSYNLPVDKLIGGLQKAFSEAVQPGEKAFFILSASSGEALCAMEKRVLVLKAGFAAGNADAYKARPFPYDSIMKVEVKSGMVQGMLQILAPGVKPVNAGSADAYKADNVVTFIGEDHRDKFERAGKAINQLAMQSHQ